MSLPSSVPVTSAVADFEQRLHNLKTILHSFQPLPAEFSIPKIVSQQSRTIENRSLVSSKTRSASVFSNREKDDEVARLRLEVNDLRSRLHALEGQFNKLYSVLSASVKP